jgi:4-amino-4-deoxy-L-arabinose transferase-like glycosyltransferase
MVAFVLVLSLLVLLRLRDKLTDGAALVAGAVVGLVCLTKMFLLVYAFLAVVWILLQPGDARRLRRCAAVLVGGLALVLAPWVARNWAVVGKPRLTSTDAGLVLWGANTESWLVGAHTQAVWPPIEFEQNFETLKGMDELARDKWFVQEGLKSIKAHRWDYAQRVLNRIWVMWKPFPYQSSYAGLMPKLRVVAMSFTFVPMLALFFIGAWKLRAEIRLYGIIYALLLAVTAATSLAHATGRYRTPLEPLMILIAAFAAERLFASWRSRKRRPESTVHASELSLPADGLNVSRGGRAGA